MSQLDFSSSIFSEREKPQGDDLSGRSVRSRSRTGRRLIRLSILAIIGVVGAGSWAARSKLWKVENPALHLPKVAVAKADLSTVLTAFGRVESSSNTTISCEIERLEIRGVASGGSSTILSVVPEGTKVKKGDVLCSLDSSDYEELVRTQEIRTLQAAAALRQAELSFEVAEIAVKEYELGLYAQNLQSMKGSIILAQSDLERAVDRLQWTEEMLKKGYLPASKKADAVQSLSRCEFDLQTFNFNLKNFIRYGNTRTRMELSAEVEKRREEVIANKQRTTRQQERLDHYKKMVELCTIRAPHDGFLIYVTDPYRPGALPLEPGLTVRQGQKLFYLPDLSKMEVVAYVHESVASRVREGMRAHSKIEGLANRSLEGHVVSVAPLPTAAGNWISNEVKYFVCVVQLDSVPRGLLPGMSAEVEFDIDRGFDVLAVPSEAIAFDEQGHNVCYVAGVDGLERRPVTLGRSTPNLLEVTGGLQEGEEVVLSPDKIEAIDSMVVHTEHDASTDTAEPVSNGSTPVSVD